jgi:hypothetical protein
VIFTVHNYNPELKLEKNESNEMVPLKGGVLGTYIGSSSMGVSYKLDSNKEAVDEENTLFLKKQAFIINLLMYLILETLKRNKQYVNNIANPKM